MPRCASFARHRVDSSMLATHIARVLGISHLQRFGSCDPLFRDAKERQTFISGLNGRAYLLPLSRIMTKLRSTY